MYLNTYLLDKYLLYLSRYFSLKELKCNMGSISTKKIFIKTHFVAPRNCGRPEKEARS